MKMQQDAVKQRNNMGEPIDFDVDYAVGNLLTDQDNWKSFVSDKIGGRYFLQDYIVENEQAITNGDIPPEKLTIDSFHPDYDNRLHQYFSGRIKRSFDPNYMSEQEKANQPEQAKKTFQAPSVKLNTKNNK